MAITKTKESRNPKEGDKLHPVKVLKGKKGPDGKEQKMALIGTSKVGLGRVKDPKDDRDKKAKLSSVSGPVSTVLPSYKYWGDGTWRGDQDGTSQCVSYSNHHRVRNSPVPYISWPSGLTPAAGYAWMQQNDEWPGENYDGTSVRAGCAYFAFKGYLSEYQRITSMGDCIDWLRRPASAGGGPLVIGIDWTNDMFSPVWMKDLLGDYRWMIVPTGALAGGHAILWNGVNITRGTARLLNSWGTRWGVNGRVSILLSHLEDLLFHRGGDVWRPVERRVA